ncbi:MAG: acyltransferase family protein [Bacteroidaceae bacterium]|nr:acyltransferase family protein [Bacteroidaceae bacterium]
MSAQRNYALDLLKCFAALMVVFLHYNKVMGEFGVLYSEIVRSITRLAVPLFFMITGYYLPVIVEKDGQNQQIIKILKLAFGSTAFYFVYRLIDASFTSSVSGWLTSHYTIGSVFSWIFLNDDPACYHLWYLYALLYSVLFYAVLYHFKLQRHIAIITLCLFILVFVANYTDVIFVRNYLLGIPCIGCGVLVREKQLKVTYRQIFIPLSMLLVIAEMLFFHKSLDVYTFSIPLALCMLTWAIDNPSKGKGTSFAMIGMKLSAYIYIFHVFVDNMIGNVLNYDTTILQVLRPFIVFISATLFSYMYVKFKALIYGA